MILLLHCCRIEHGWWVVCVCVCNPPTQKTLTVALLQSELLKMSVCHLRSCLVENHLRETDKVDLNYNRITSENPINNFYSDFI